MAKKKPDMFAENKAIMPYGDSVGAPSIKPTDLTAYKQEKVLKTNHYFESRFKAFQSKVETWDRIPANEYGIILFNSGTAPLLYSIYFALPVVIFLCQ